MRGSWKKSMVRLVPACAVSMADRRRYQTKETETDISSFKWG